METSSLCPMCRESLRPPPPPVPIVTRRAPAPTRRGVISAYRTTSVDRRTPRGIRRDPRRDLGRDQIRVGSPALSEVDEVEVEVDIDDFANNAEIRAEIMSGLIHSQCRQGNTSALRDLLSENPDLVYSRGDMGDLLTHEAVLSEDESVLMYVVNDRGVDVNLPNSAHMYPLHYAVVSGSLRMVTILVNRGAYIDCVNDSRMTPLMMACESDDPALTQFLLDRGASTRTQDGSGNFPIHIASRAKSYSCVSKLISSGSSGSSSGSSGSSSGSIVNVRNHFHDTPLHVSCRLGFHSVSRLLLEEGADPEIENKFDYSPLDEASTGGNTRMRNLLARYITSPGNPGNVD
jgi:ankyrin repeat protein